MITGSGHQHSGASAAGDTMRSVLIAVGICGSCCIVLYSGLAIQPAFRYLHSMCLQKRNNSSAESVVIELDQHHGMGPHATAVSINTQCVPDSVDKVEAWQYSTCDLNSLDILLCQEERPVMHSLDILLWQEERPAIPQTVARPKSFLVPQRAPEMEIPLPLCSRCKGRMAWSCRRDGLYRQGWHCDNFAACGSSGANSGTHRWHCSACCEDVCGGCAGCPEPLSPESPWDLWVSPLGLAGSPRGPGRVPRPGARPSPTPRLASPSGVGPGGLTPVAPCPELKKPEAECAVQEGDVFSSLGIAALRTWDVLVAAGENRWSDVQPSRPPPELVI